MVALTFFWILTVVYMPCTWNYLNLCSCWTCWRGYLQASKRLNKSSGLKDSVITQKSQHECWLLYSTQSPASLKQDLLFAQVFFKTLYCFFCCFSWNYKWLIAARSVFFLGVLSVHADMKLTRLFLYRTCYQCVYIWSIVCSESDFFFYWEHVTQIEKASFGPATVCPVH